MENEELSKLKKELEEVKQRNHELEDKLKKYTCSERHKRYYEKNTEVAKERAKKYMDKIKETNPEKLKEWRHNAYLKRKEKLNEQNDVNNN
jgi:hypothetical protein